MANSELELPSSHHAEVTILGAMMVDAQAVTDAVELLSADDFSLNSHRQIYAAMLGLHARQATLDIVTVSEALRARKEIDSIGGVAYLASLSEGLPRRLSIESYIRIVREKAVARKGMGIADSFMQEMADPSTKPHEALRSVSARIQALQVDADAAPLQPIASFLDAMPEDGIVEALALTDGVQLGWHQWDEVTHGAQPGMLYVFAARPGMGKTAAACNIAHSISARTGKIVAHFSFEDSAQAVVTRMLSAASGIRHDDIVTGHTDRRDREVILAERHRLHSAPLYLWDGRGLTVSGIRAKCSRLKRTTGLDMIVIDQLSYLDDADVVQRGMLTTKIIDLQCRALKVLARELGVPVLLFAQLKRASSERADPTPRLTDLGESKGLEENADVVTFLHRPEYYDRADQELIGKGVMLIEKNRHGPTKTINCTYTGSIMRWEDTASQHASTW